MKPQQRTPFDGPFMALLCTLTFVVVEGITIQAGGQVASWAFGGHHVVFGPIGTGASTFGHLVHHLADPRLAWDPAPRSSLPGPVALWASLLLTHVVVVGLIVVAVRVVRHLLGTSGTPHGGQPKATRTQVERRMGRRAVERHTAALYGKDAVARREPLALGVDVATGVRLFAKSEDYILAVGVPRVGKGEGFVIPSVLRHKGPTVVTATRHDTYMDTVQVRTGVGPVFVFDPQGLVPSAEKLCWNPVKGCEVPQTAIFARPRVRRLRRRRTGARRRRGLLGAGGGLRHSFLPSRRRTRGLGCRNAPRVVASSGGSRTHPHPGAPCGRRARVGRGPRHLCRGGTSAPGLDLGHGPAGLRLLR